MRILNRSLLFCLAFALLASIASAETMEFSGAGNKDTYVDSSSPDSSGGAYAECLFMGIISGTRITRGYFGFDISALPDDATIDDVTLDLRGYNPDAYGTTPVTFEIRSTTAFSSSTCTWNTAPALGTLLSDVDVAPHSVAYGHLVTFDSSTAFASAAQDAYDGNGWLYFGIKKEVEDSARNLLRMCSLEASGAYANLKPVLTVDYSVVPEPSMLTLLLLLPFCVAAIRLNRRRP